MAIEGISSTQDIKIYVESDGSPMIAERPGGAGSPPEVEVTYLAKWAERFLLYGEMRGGFALINGMGVPLPGHAYPPSKDIYFHSFGTVKPLGLNKKEVIVNPDVLMAEKVWNWPKWCLIPVTYRPVEFGWDAGSAAPTNNVTQIDPAQPILGCKQRIETTNSYIVFDAGKIEILKSRDELISQDPKKTYGSTDGIPANTVSFTLDYPRVPRNPWMFLSKYIGTVNAFPLWGLPKGHILFASSSIDVQYQFGGPEIVASLNFIGNRDMAWNETLDDDGIFKPKVFVVNDGANFRFPFRATDLSQVFS